MGCTTLCRPLQGPTGKLSAVPFTEHCYRLFWVHRRDVFRILMSLAVRIDGAIWPQEDAEAVQQLLSLVKQVIGRHFPVELFNRQS